jgi:23S rRNA pseudouridine2605 synthase
MNKPRGLVTTASDEKGRQTVYSIFQTEESLPWVAPVGRLDKASEGLLLLTNDSEWAARVTAPETRLEKIYHVQIAKVADEELARAMTKGIRTKDGEVLRVGQCRVLRSGAKSCWLEVVLEEGKNRHIRRMLEPFDIEVLRLVRVAIGPLHLGKLAKGSFRTLMPEEKLALDRAMKSVKPEV